MQSPPDAYCDECRVPFAYFSEWSNHMWKEHNRGKDQQGRDVQVIGKGGAYCTICHKITYLDLDEHTTNYCNPPEEERKDIRLILMQQLLERG